MTITSMLSVSTIRNFISSATKQHGGPTDNEPRKKPVLTAGKNLGLNGALTASCVSLTTLWQYRNINPELQRLSVPVCLRHLYPNRNQKHNFNLA